MGDLLGPDGLTDHRWEGYSDDELAEVVDLVTTGRGSESMNHAADTLDGVTDALRQIDLTLYQQLGAIGVHWQSKQASGLATGAIGESRDYNDGAMGQVTVSARSVNDQGGAYDAGKRGMPDSSALRQNPQRNLLDEVGSFITGNESDYTQAVRAKNQARYQAIDGLNNYGSSSRRNLAAHQPLPPVPPVNVHTPEAVAGGSTSAASYQPPVSPPPAVPGAGGLPPVPGAPPVSPVVTGPPTTPLPNLGGRTGVAPFAPGAGPAGPVSPAPLGGAGPVAGAGPVSGGPAFGVAPVPPVGGSPTGGSPTGGGTPLSGTGKVMGVGPTAPGAPGQPPATAAVPPKGIGPTAMNSAAMGAAIAGGAGATAAGMGGEQERLVRGGRGGQVRPLGALPDEETAASRTASRVGSTSEQRRSVLQPATGSTDEDEDGEHVRRYGVEAEDLFVDQRMVATPVLGDDEAK